MSDNILALYKDSTFGTCWELNIFQGHPTKDWSGQDRSEVEKVIIRLSTHVDKVKRKGTFTVLHEFYTGDLSTLKKKAVALLFERKFDKGLKIGFE